MSLRIRSITYFFSAKSLDDAVEGVHKAAEVLATAKAKLEAKGYEIQTTRVATNSFEDYLGQESVEDAVTSLQELESASKGIDFLSVGTVEKRLDVMEAALSGKTQKTFFVIPIGLTKDGIPDRNAALQAAGLICRLSASAPAKTTAVPDLFRTTVTGNLDHGTPYFPGAYWKTGDAPALALALEDTGILVKAFAGATSMEAAQKALEDLMTKTLVPLELVAKDAAREADVIYAGIDCSIASSSKPEESLVVAYESLGLGSFGGAGTLSISALVTAVMKRLSVTRCGYSGLMLPLTEDAGLAQRGNDGRLSVQQLLFYSAVCGTGIDTVPIEGSTKPERLAMVYMDMASLAFRLKKPLSARLWPVAGKKVGDMTEVDNPFFVNTKVLAVDPVMAMEPPPTPTAGAESCAGVGGEVVLLSDSPEAVVVRISEACGGVVFVLRNQGVQPWPHDTRLCMTGSLSDGERVEALEVPPAVAGEAVTICVINPVRGGQYRLTGNDMEFGPALIMVA